MITGINFELDDDAVLKAKHQKDTETAFYMCLEYGLCPKCGNELLSVNKNKREIVECKSCTFAFNFNNHSVVEKREEKAGV